MPGAWEAQGRGSTGWFWEGEVSWGALLGLGVPGRALGTCGLVVTLPLVPSPTSHFPEETLAQPVCSQPMTCTGQSRTVTRLLGEGPGRVHSLLRSPLA